VICRIAKVGKVELTKVDDFSHSEGANVFLDEEFCLTISVGKTNLAAERERLSNQLDEAVGYLTRLDVRLQSDAFTQKAKPEIIPASQKDKEKMEAKIAEIEKRLEPIGSP